MTQAANLSGTGICKAWIQYNGVTQTVLSSFNVSSVTYAGNGYYTINFTTSMPSSNYAVTITSNGVVNTQHTNGYLCDGVTTYGATTPSAPSASSFNVWFTSSANGGATANQSKCCFVVFSN